jgi:hypothetical protein
MKIGVIIVGGMIFVLGLATALLSIHVAQLGTDATGWHLPTAIGYPIEALQALERTHSLHMWLLYFGLGTMVVGLDLMLTVLVISNLGMKGLRRSLGRRNPTLPTHSRSASHS